MGTTAAVAGSIFRNALVSSKIPSALNERSFMHRSCIDRLPRKIETKYGSRGTDRAEKCDPIPRRPLQSVTTHHEDGARVYKSE